MSLAGLWRAVCGLSAALVLAVAASAAEPPAEPILRIETGMHTAKITDIAAGPDGLIATVSDDKTVRLWRAADGAALAVVRPPIAPGGDGVLNAALFTVSPNGVFLLTGGLSGQSWDGTNWLYVIDAGSGAIRHRVSLDASVVDLALHAPGGEPRHLAIAYSNPASARFGVLVTNRGLGALHDIPLASAPVAVDFAADGRLLVVMGGGGVAIYPPAAEAGPAPRPLVSGKAPDLAGVRSAPLTARFSPDGKRLAIGHDGRRAIDVLRASDLRPVASLPFALPAGTAQISALAWAKGADGRDALWAAGGAAEAGGRRLVFRWRDVAKPNAVQSVAVSRNVVTALTPLADGGMAFAAADPTWGVIGADMALRASVAARGPDQRELFARGFAITPDGGRVRVALDAPDGARRLLTLDLARLSAGDTPLDGPTIAQSPPPSLERWRNLHDPVLGGVALRMEPGELARSAHAMSDGRVVIGADFSLHLFAADGTRLARRAIESPAFAVATSADGQRLVAALGDGTLRWFSMAPDAPFTPLGGAFVALDGRWAAWLEDGRFAASADSGAALVGYHVNRGGKAAADWVELDQMFERMYAPDAVRWVLGRDQVAGERLAAAAAAAAGAAAQADAASLLSAAAPPKVALAALCFEGGPAPDGCVPIDKLTRGVGRVAAKPAEADFALPKGVRDARLRFRAALAGEPAAINVFVNGRTAGALTRGVGRAERAREGDWRDYERPLRLAVGENRIGVRVTGADGLDGNAPEIVVTAAPDVAPTRTLHVLVVGADAYRGEIPRLPGVATDAKDFLALFDSHAARRGGPGDGYDAVSITPLMAADATRERILAAIDGLAATVGPRDAMVIYLGGHAYMVDDRYVFVPTDVIRKSEIAAQGVSENDILERLSAIAAENVLLVLDTCHAGGFPSEVAGRLNHRSGYYVLAASAEVEEALDSAGRNSALMTALLEATVGGMAMLPDGTVTAWNAGDHVSRRVAEIAGERGHKQEAQFLAAARASFPLVRPPRPAPDRPTP